MYSCACASNLLHDVLTECKLTLDIACRAHAVQGGGVFLRGLQNDQLGSTGQGVIHNTTIAHNTAGFGGGIACDSCRALLLANDISNNVAVRRASGDQAASAPAGPAGVAIAGITVISSTGSSEHGSGSFDSSSSSSTGSCGADDLGLEPAGLMSYQVRGSGGAIAANLAGNSFLVLCGGTGDIKGNTVVNNHAHAVGGAVYVNHTESSSRCEGPQAQGSAGDICLEASAGLWPSGCGVTMFNTDWSNSSSDAGGDLLGWAGSDGFNMVCTGSGSACSTPGSFSSNSSPAVLSSRFSWRGSSNRSKGMCFTAYTARSPGACLPANAAPSAGSSAAPSRMSITSADLKFELPTSLGVYNASCLQQADVLSSSGTTVDYSKCAVAGVKGATVPKVFSGGEPSVVKH